MAFPESAPAQLSLDRAARSLLVLGLILGLPLFRSFAAFPPWTVRQWTVDDGLPANQLSGIEQTTDGYLWLKFDREIGHFDGVQYQRLETGEKGLAPTFETCRKRLWLRSDQHPLLALSEGKLIPVSLPPGSSGSLHWAVEDSEGATWIAIGEQTYHWRDGHWLGSGIFQLGLYVEQSPGRWWAAYQGKFGLWSARGFEPAAASPSDVPARAEMAAARRGGGIWFVTRDSATKFSLRALRNDNTIANPVTLPWEHGLTLLTDICEDRAGRVWIASSTQGVVVLMPGGNWLDLGAALKVKLTMPRRLFEDLEGNIWIGSDGEGLFRVSPRAFTTYGQAEGLTTENAYSVAPAREGGVWVGTHSSVGRGLFRLQDGHAVFDAGMGSYGWSVLEDSRGDLWVGNLQQGLFHRHDGISEHVPGSPSDVFALCEDGAGGLWVGGSGLAHYSQGALNEIADFPVKSEISALRRDHEGVLWAGTKTHGVHFLSRGKWSSLTKASGLPDDDILSLAFDARNDLWIGTRNGLARRHEGKLMTLTMAEGLGARAISGLAEDNEGNVWFHSPTGIFRARRRDLDAYFEGRQNRVFCIGYGRNDGLSTGASTSGTQSRVCQDREGRLWFTTLQGVAMTQPALLPVNTNPPPMLIEEIFADGARASRGEFNNPSRPLRFAPGLKRLEIHFTANSLTVPEKVLFRYRLGLGGSSGEWQDHGKRRELVFDHLPPGPYEFKVKACNNDGLWTEHPATLAFEVLPFFWQTNAFKRSIWVLAAIALAWLFRHWATRPMRLRLARAEQQAGLERERARISQDMHDDLGATLTRIAMLSELAKRSSPDPSSVQPHLESILNAAGEATQSLSELVWAVQPAHDTLASLIDHICQITYALLHPTNIRYRLDLPPEPPQCEISSEIRHQIVQTVKEALNNAVKHSSATEIRVALTFENRRLSLSISDDGKGFIPGAPRPVTGGNGLVNMEQRLAKIGGRFEIATRPGQGTCITIAVTL